MTAKVQSKLAKLLAMENINVYHDARVDTASFDLALRELTLPMFKDMEGALHDMLVGHEIGHALWTPLEEWRAALKDVSKGYLNVLEDARIEKKVKEKYPGLRRDFIEGYKEMWARDFFGVANKDLSKLALIDRLNIHFKVRESRVVTIPFSADEMKIVKRVDEMKTFEDVVALAKELYGPKKKLPEIKFNKSEEFEAEEFDIGWSEPHDDIDDSPVEEDEIEDDSDAPDSDDSDFDDSDDSDFEEFDGLVSGSDDIVAGPGNDEVIPPSSGGFGYDAEIIEEDSEEVEEPATQEAFDENLKKEVVKKTKEYGIPPSMFTLDGCKTVAIGWKDVSKMITHCRKETYNNSGAYYDSEDRKKNLKHSMLKSDMAFKKFVTGSKYLSESMARNFNVMKAADEHHRTNENITGTLDTNLMCNYQTTDNIFRTDTIVRDGKSHGIMLLIDASGSMHGRILDVVKQALVMVNFAKSSKIPFEVYLYSSSMLTKTAQEFLKDIGVGGYTTTTPDGVERQDYVKQYGGEYRLAGNTNLLNIISSDMNAKQLRSAEMDLYRYARCCGEYYSDDDFLGGGMNMGSTPTFDALVGMISEMEKFTTRNKLQVPNLIMLTDGDGSMRGYYERNGSEGRINSAVGSGFTDKKTKIFYSLDSHISGIRSGSGSYEQLIMKLMKSRYGANSIIYYVGDSTECNAKLSSFGNNDGSDKQRELRSNGFVSVGTDQMGCDDYFIMHDYATRMNKEKKGGIRRIDYNPIPLAGEKKDKKKIAKDAQKEFAKKAKLKKEQQIFAQEIISIIANSITPKRKVKKVW